MGAAAHFSPTYAEAREHFLASAGLVAARIEHIPHPLPGVEGENTGIDLAHLGNPDPAYRLIFCSGTHGIEGYCGSACQSRLLQSGLFLDLPAEVGVSFIHALNPWGFSHGRRVNEDNIDLNRNFVDHARHAYPPNPLYVKLADAINPRAYDTRAVEAANQRLTRFQREEGAQTFQEILSRGQYDVADGIFYGGRCPSWSNKALHAILNQMRPGLLEAVFIDIHTGLGEFGTGEIIIEGDTDHPAYDRAHMIWPGEPTATLAGDSVSVALAGTIDEAVIHALAPAQVTPVALEFGTVPSAQVFAALRQDNWLYAHGDPLSDEAHPIKAQVRKAFYPEQSAWMSAVLARSDEVAHKALRHLTRLADGVDTRSD